MCNRVGYPWMVVGLVFLSGCQAKPAADGRSEQPDAVEAQPEEAAPKTVAPTGDREKDWILVEQAVDAWLYFHLSDFKSYQPLMRSSDYDSVRDVYVHHLRYRTMNEQGGMITLDEDFEVDLNRKGENSNPFYVRKL